MKNLITAITIVLFFSATAFAGIGDQLTHQSTALPMTIAVDQTVTPPTSTQIVYLPYCVEEYGYATGIHIAIDSREPVEMYIGMFNASSPYSMKKIIVGCNGWTGLVSGLVVKGQRFHSPSMVAFVVSGEGNCRFWVTQFIFSAQGFSHVVQESEEVK